MCRGTPEPNKSLQRIYYASTQQGKIKIKYGCHAYPLFETENEKEI